MSKICQITGKKAMVGNNVSHSKRRTKRRFNVNLFTKKFYWVEQDCWITLTLSAAGLRTINKMGLDAAIKQAAGMLLHPPAESYSRIMYSFPSPLIYMRYVSFVFTLSFS